MLESTLANVNSTGCSAVNEPNDTHEEMPCEIEEDSCDKLQHPVPVMVLVDTDTEIKETTTTLEQNCQIETASTAKSVLEENEDSVDWYKGMKLDINWLLEAENCLVLKKELKDQRKRPIVTCLLCNKYEL